ncbi:MAG: phosphatase PAP2 family protein [Deltaproteobacteria bacterium]|nr:phosphatase PAP2 family protein [Deltaproteobacteria bacterium]
MRLFTIAIWLGLAFAPISLLAQQTETEAIRPNTEESPLPLSVFERFGSNLTDSFVGINLLWHGLAVSGTAVMVATDWDGDIQRAFWDGGEVFGDNFAMGTLIVGSFTPVIIPAASWAIGLTSEEHKLASGSAAALQAVGSTFLVTTALKILTDRVAPLKNGVPNQKEEFITRTDDACDFGFNPFSFRGGFFWPSGHTASHMALASALVAFYHEEIWLPFVAYPVVAVVGLAMIEGDHHWASDVWAGAFIGHSIGWTIGKRFRRRFDELTFASDPLQRSDNPISETHPISPLPIASAHFTGLSFRGEF